MPVRVTVDPYVDPRTGVLRNLLGLTDAAGLAQAEARLAAAAEVVLFAEHLDLGHYDLPHLCAIHPTSSGRYTTGLASCERST